MPPTLKLTDHILEMLGDGEAHYEFEIATKMLKYVPPEQAVRKARVSSKAKGDVPLFRLVQMGMQVIVHGSLRQLRTRRLVIDEMKEGKRAWRLVDQETLAWMRATR